jgi:hypothetical protein
MADPGVDTIGKLPATIRVVTRFAAVRIPIVTATERPVLFDTQVATGEISDFGYMNGHATNAQTWVS